jgi:cell division protein FtsW
MDKTLKTDTLPLARPKLLVGDPVIWTIIGLLAFVSMLLVYSATGTLAYKRMEGDTEHYLLKHFLLVVLSFGAIWLCSRIDYRYYSRLSRLALLLSVPLLLFTWQFGTTLNDATRWLTIPYINQTFQPSDLAKFALIANVASMLSKRQLDIGNFEKAIFPILFWCGLICGLIALSDFSSAALLFATCMLLMFIGRVPMRYLTALVVVGLVAGMFALAVGQRGSTVRSRMEAFFSTENVPFQAEQAYIAVAKGGLVGEGPGNSSQKNFLPNPYSDFISAILVEEYGLLGALFVIGLYLTLLYRGMLAAAQSERAFGGLLSAGLSFSLVIQAMINMAVAVGLVPITGLPLPLVSMGGTSLLFTGISIGIIISVSQGEQFTLDKPSRASRTRRRWGLR